MRSTHLSRRAFLGHTAAATGAVLSAPLISRAARQATDQVTLGGTGIKMSRLGMGTGTRSGRVQAELGQEKLNHLIKYAFDQGVRYLDCAQNYRSFGMIGEAIKDLPREELFILSKIPGNPENPMEVIENHLRNFKTDYLDAMLCHCATKKTWTSDRQRLMEAMVKAKEQGKVRSLGVSCHSIDALRIAARTDWVQVNLVRVNPQAKHTDKDPNKPGIHPVMDEIKVMKENGHGVIGMKIIGNGDFTDPEDREKSVRFAMAHTAIHAVTIGYKAPAEVDEAIKRINRALAAAS